MHAEWYKGHWWLSANIHFLFLFSSRTPIFFRYSSPQPRELAPSSSLRDGPYWSQCRWLVQEWTCDSIQDSETEGDACGGCWTPFSETFWKLPSSDVTVYELRPQTAAALLMAGSWSHPRGRQSPGRGKKRSCSPWTMPVLKLVLYWDHLPHKLMNFFIY